jgi:hypothetical protein
LGSADSNFNPNFKSVLNSYDNHRVERNIFIENSVLFGYNSGLTSVKKEKLAVIWFEITSKSIGFGSYETIYKCKRRDVMLREEKVVDMAFKVIDIIESSKLKNKVEKNRLILRSIEIELNSMIIISELLSKFKMKILQI